MSRRATTFQLFVAAFTVFTLTSIGAGQVINDPLQGSTTGTRSGGSFVSGGWQVTNQYDSIYYHIGTYGHGAFQYYVKGLPASTCPGPFNSKNELHETYDYTYNNADNSYAPGFQGDPFKEYYRKQCDSGKEGKMENLWQISPGTLEDDTAPLSWNPSSNYKMHIEWFNTGGNSIKYSYRNDALFWTQVLPGSWSPAGNSVRIAASTRRADEGASVGAIYSYVTAYDLNSYVPPAPTVSIPTNGGTVKDQVVYIQWTGELHTIYQVRCNTANDPNAGIFWDSQQVTSGRNFTWSGTLPNGTIYVFVRLGTASGMGPWSATGRTFIVNTSFNPTGTNYVQVNGNSYRNFSGPFIGLGFSHFRALQRTKFDRTRYTNDLAYMSSKGFVYQRILSMVAWDGIEIAPVSFNGPTHFVNAWSDYDQQFKDMIDIAYDTYGIKTEVTIFADAQWVMNNDGTRMAHLDRILADLVGREHKVVLLEVGNESWQNGFGGPWGYNDVVSKAQYLADRTPIPVASSSPVDTSDTGMYAAQSDNAVDVATVHFSRDTSESGWVAARDSYRNGPAGMAPLSSNEPIGPGSSVATENDPIKLVMAGVFAWTANCVSYVFHSKAGVQSWTSCCPVGGTEVFFSSTPGSGSYVNILPLLPKEMSSWAHNDGKEAASPFTNFCAGQANKWWPEVGGATDGCNRDISTIKAGRFVACPMGILGGGLTLQARRPMKFKAYNPMAGTVAYDLTKNANDTFTLSPGEGAYVIIGDFTDLPIDNGVVNGQMTLDMGTTDIANGLSNLQNGDGNTTPVTIGGRDCRKNVSVTVDRYFYFAVSDGYAYQGSKPDQYINVDYYDTGTSTLSLNYDATDGNFYKGGPSVVLTNTNTWKTVTWHITDAYFGNRENAGADFRIFNSATTNFYFDKLAVYQKAFSGTAQITPVTLQAEDFDNGGEGQAYHDTTTTNDGGQYRLGDAVDIEGCADTGGGFDVGFTAANEYLNYQVNVATAGSYDIKLRVASPAANGTYHIEINGVNVSGTRTIPNTGGYQIWADTTVSSITLSAGVQTLKVFMEVAGWNLNYINVDKHQGPFGGSARAIPGTIQSEDFDDGGQGVSYNDTEATNFGGSYRTGEWVDITTTADTGGGYIVGWIVAGEWMEYTVNVNQTGDYAVKLRVASAGGGGALHMSIDGVNIFNTRSFGDTGGWDTWTTIIVPGVFLSAGNNKVLRITADVSSYNINYMDFSFSGADVVSLDMGNPNVNDGMQQIVCCDGNTVAWTIGGHTCQNNATVPDHYMYFEVTDGYAFQGNKPVETITIDYLDKNAGTFLQLQYDGASSSYTAGANENYTNSNTWKTAVWSVSDAYFGNRQNGGADFRIYYSGVDFYIDTVTVFAGSGSPPGIATNPSPASGATGVSLSPTLTWTAGSGTTSHDVRFGTANPPPFVINQTAASYSPGALTTGTVYYWRIDEKNASGTTTGTVWSFTTTSVTVPTLNVKAVSSPITVDGSSSDWVLGDFVTKVRGGEILSGDIGLVGWDGATVYRGAYVQVLPTNAADHTAKIYSRHNSTYLYFLVRLDDNQIQTQNPLASNWANDCVEIYIDPTNDGGSTAMSNSTSDIQLVIDPLNQKNVYMCTSGYTTQVLAGVTSAVTTDGTGWWAEVRITKTALDGDIPSTTGTIGLDFNFRDNDNNNDPTLTTVYTWADTSTAGFPSKIPGHWGDATLATLVLPGQASNPSPANSATLVSITSTLSWTAGSGATSHDVRFGTANPPPFVINQTATTYNPGTTSPGTTYYWRIDEVNAAGSTTGVVWSYTTLPLPGAASSPNPPTGATLVDKDANLSWTAGSNTTSHDVRFGTVNPPPFVINQTATTYDPGTLAANTLYYWRIDEKNGSGTTTGTVWSYTTLPLPGAASSPSPANGATLVDITSSLTWTAGSNAASHDVRFGTVNPPPFVTNLTGTTTYTPATMTPNTVYYWRIDEINTSGTTTGTVWSFTTLPLPGAASSPSPANGATLVAITSALTWTAGSNTVSHDVRFGTVNPPPFIQNQAGTSYNPTKSPNTLYYWRIDEINTSGSTTGTVWSFTTLPVPGAASSPSPANGATLVAITTALTWTAGSNAASHDVRFGTANPPPFIQNQAGTSYNPTKSANTLYYWRIDEVNTSGTTTGTVWSFTTLPVPGAASAPNPASGATGVSVTPTLTWTAGSNAASHDVRFGTANPPPFVQNQAGTSYAPSTLAGGTLYYWRIDEVNSSGSTTGTVWSFTTAASIPNYIQNSGFEGGFGAAGGGFNGNKGNTWTAFLYGGANSDLTFADETGSGNFDTGAHSQKITAAAGKEGGVYNQFAVTNGNTYTVSVRVKSGSGAAWCFLGIHTAGGTDSHEASGTIYPANNNRSTSWTTLSWTGQATGSLITVFLDTYDGVGYWDTAAPGQTTVISNSAFASTADGWNIVVWKSNVSGGTLGTMAFESGTGNPAGDMLSGAAGATNSTDSCTREGGEINKAISTSGYSTLIQLQYDIRMSTDQTGTACSGGCAPLDTLEVDCADKIAVYYSTAGTSGPWTLLEQVYASSITQNVWSTRTINCPAGANNQANFAVRLRWQFNTLTIDTGRLDNIKVIGTP